MTGVTVPEKYPLIPNCQENPRGKGRNALCGSACCDGIGGIVTEAVVGRCAQLAAISNRMLAARVRFYREVDTAAENTTTPYVRLTGAIFDVPVQGGAFYRDVPPGRYQITINSEGMSPSLSRDVALVAGKQIYVRISLGGSWNGQGIYHHGAAERGRTHCNPAQPILWRWRIERQSSRGITSAALRLLTLKRRAVPRQYRHKTSNHPMTRQGGGRAARCQPGFGVTD